MTPFQFQDCAVSTIGEAADKESVLALAARQFADCYHVPHDRALETLKAREELGSTGFGRGAAIPHGRLDDVAIPLAVFLKVERPVDFNAVDALPVDLVFALISPERDGARHLRALAYISRLMRDDAVLSALRGAGDNDAIFGLLTERLAHAA